MPGVHATTTTTTEMMQLSRLSPDIPRIDILEHEPESQMGNNLFDMFAASVHFSGNHSSAGNTNNGIGNSGNNALNNNNNTAASASGGANSDTTLALQDRQMFPEISGFPEHAAAGAGQSAGAARQPGLEFDSFQFLRNSMFAVADREKDLISEDVQPVSMQQEASPSSPEAEAPVITKLWTDCDDSQPHCSDELEFTDHQQQPRCPPYELLGARNTRNSRNNNSSLEGASFKTSSSWGVSRSSTVVEPSAASKPKRKRSRPCKSTEEVESQRMTHIAVERNRRRQMNEHLRVLRSLMPGSYVQRGDQASIIGGAIEFVKELQQLLQCLEEQKKRKMSLVESPARLLGSPGMLQAMAAAAAGGFVGGPYAPGVSGCLRTPPPPDVKYFDAGGMYEPVREVYGEAKSELADVEVKIVGMSAHIKILSQKKPGQLLKTMTALENKLLLTIVHTNVTTIEQTVLYSFDVKVGQNCGLAEEIAAYIHNTLAASSSSSIPGLEELSLQH